MKDDWLAKAIENGIGPYDLSKAIIDNAKTKYLRKGGGFYVNVPFEHQMATKAKFSASKPGMPIGYAYGSTPRGLGAAVIAAVADLVEGGSGLEAGVGGAGPAEIYHSTDPFAGMKLVGGAFKTFRRLAVDGSGNVVGENADLKWQHPGIQAAHLGDQAREDVTEALPKIIQAVIQSAM
jgi:hypothetical protein